ncbi:MAG: CDP-alcohol phosphatidyltransferase family protein [Verrucomicrobiales bacterium]|nr:CDP-alcohol phosphatidyltransferase family protein [Verrucomicrobiales bacterium]
MSTAGERRPAVILVDAGTSRLKVAALTLLDRQLIAVHRAGCGPIRVVCEGALPLPRGSRAMAWKVPFEVIREWDGRREGPTVVLRTDCLVSVADAKRLAAAAGPVRLADADGGVLNAALLADGSAGWEAAMAAAPLMPAQGVACRVGDGETARVATRELWGSITSATDGWVDRVFNRPVGRPFSRLLIHTPVTPNMISVAATLLGLIAAVMFAQATVGWSIAAALLFQVSAILDCMDGDVARVVFKESPLGKWLDIVGDQVVHIGVFLGIAVGVGEKDGVPEAAWLGGLAAVGAAISFAVVLRGMKAGASGGGMLGRLLDAATNRDFSVLVLVLAFIDRLVWFLWLAAVGSHLFWMLLLGLQLGWRRNSR